MQFFISFVLIFACFFRNSEAGETQAMLDLFTNLASESPPTLSKQTFTEFVEIVFKAPTPTSNIDAWYKVFPQNRTQQEMIDFCRVYGDILKVTWFTMPAAKIHGGNIESLYKTCDGWDKGKLTLAGLTKFVGMAFAGVTKDTINTWDKIVNAVPLFDLDEIKLLCKINADKLTHNYVNPKEARAFQTQTSTQLPVI